MKNNIMNRSLRTAAAAVSVIFIVKKDIAAVYSTMPNHNCGNTA